MLLPAVEAVAAVQEAALASTEDISWFFLVVGMLGGLALFLYGLEKMSEGLKKAAGNQMRNILAALTRNRVIALFAGAFVTTVIQSSSATTVILVSFVQAGLMSFAQSLGVILGADIGTTITAQLIAFKLTDSALLMVAGGFCLRMFARRRTMVTIGDIILGFGLLFYGMKLMSDAMAPLRAYEGFIQLLYGLEHPLMGLLVGMLFTALIQSSSAFTGIVIVLSQQGLITLEAGIPMVFGANIGTCITAGFASLGMSREAKRVALAHVVFKVTGVLLFIFWIPAFATLIRDIAQHISADMGRQIANAHTIFNVSMALVFLPFTNLFARLIQKLLPEQKGVQITRDIRTWYLDDSCIETPEVAIGLARAELARMAKLLERMLRAVIIPFMSDERLVAKDVAERDEARLLKKEIPKRDEIFPELTIFEGLDMREEKIDFLEEKIGDYLNRVLRQNISANEVNEVFGMMSIAKDMESIGDIIHRNILPLIEKKRELDSDFSEEGKEELLIYHDKVCRHIRLLKQAFSETNQQQSCRIMGQERTYLDLESQYRLKHLDRVRHQKEESMATHEVHMELLDLLKQIMVYSSHIAEAFSRTCALTSRAGKE